MIAPNLWAAVPFQNRTALLDWQGQHALWHQAVADTAAAAGKKYATYPLGDGVGTPDWQRVHAQEHVNANLALGISGPPSLTDFDFAKAEDFASFHWTHGQESERLRAAAGVS